MYHSWKWISEKTEKTPMNQITLAQKIKLEYEKENKR